MSRHSSVYTIRLSRVAPVMCTTAGRLVLGLRRPLSKWVVTADGDAYAGREVGRARYKKGGGLQLYSALPFGAKRKVLSHRAASLVGQNETGGKLHAGNLILLSLFDFREG